MPFVVPLVYGLGDAAFCDCTSTFDSRLDLRLREGVVGEVGGDGPVIVMQGLRRQNTVGTFCYNQLSQIALS